MQVTSAAAPAFTPSVTLDPWSALIAAAMSPDDWIVTERDGELHVEPAPRRS